MHLSIREIEDITIIDLSGNIMGGTDSELFKDKMKELLEQGKKKVILNLAKVSWVSSSGLGIIISGYTSFKNQGGRVVLLNATKKVKNILTITKLFLVFKHFEDEAEAIAEMNRMSEDQENS